MARFNPITVVKAANNAIDPAVAQIAVVEGISVTAITNSIAGKTIAKGDAAHAGSPKFVIALRVPDQSASLDRPDRKHGG